MKKKLAILLTLLMVFNVFGTVGLTASAAITGIATNVTEGQYFKVATAITFSIAAPRTITSATDAVNGGAAGAVASGFSAVAGSHVLTIVSGTETQVINFKVDDSAPTFTGLPGSGYSAVAVSPVVADKTYSGGAVGSGTATTTTTITKNGGAAVTFVAGTVLDTEGTYVITATDAAGNVSTSTFIIDAARPVITLSPIVTSAITAGAVEITATTNKGTFGTSRNNTETQILTPSTTATFVATDKAGNTATLKVDATTAVSAPGAGVTTQLLANIVAVNANTNATSLAGPTIVSKTYKGTDANLASGLAIPANTAITVDGVAYTIAGASLPATAGNHTIVVTYTLAPAAAVSSTYVYTVDNTAPVFTGATTGAFYNTARTITWDNGTAAYGYDADLDGVVDAGDSIGFDANGNGVLDAGDTFTGVFTAGTVLDADGKYFIGAIDATGNISSISFMIDTLKPTISYTSMTPNVTVNPTTGVISFNNNDTFTNADALSGIRTFTINGLTMGNTTTFTSAVVALASTQYVLEVTDKAGNSKTLTVVINRATGLITGFTSGATYNTDITPVGTGVITYGYDVDADGVFDATDGDIATGTVFASGTTVSASGKYSLVQTDAFGIIQSVKNFTIDKVAPTVKNGQFIFTDSSVNVATLTLTINDNIGIVTTSLTRDGSKVVGYTPGVAIATEGTYVLTVTDAAGNVTAVNFKIDRTAPVISGVINGTVYTSLLIPVITDASALTLILNGADYLSGRPITNNGRYVLVATDATGLTTTVNFLIDTPAPIITGVTEGAVYKSAVKPIVTDSLATVAKLNAADYTIGSSIQNNGSYTLIVKNSSGASKTVNFKIAIDTPNVTGVSEGKTYTVPITPIIADSLTYSAKLNGVAYTSGTKIEKNGKYILTVTNSAGAVTTVSFKLEVAPPVITGVTTDGVYGSGTKATITSGFDYVARLNGSMYTSGTVITDGAYELRVTDTAGNNVVVTFTVDTKAPLVIGVANGDSYRTDVIPVVDATATVVKLDGVVILRESIIVSSEGNHTLIATDAYGNSTSVTFIIDKTKPTITAKTKDGRTVGYYAGVKFSRNSYVLVKASGYSSLIVTKDGKIIKFGEGVFTAKGKYIFNATDSVENVKNYIFVIK